MLDRFIGQENPILSETIHSFAERPLKSLVDPIAILGVDKLPKILRVGKPSSGSNPKIRNISSEQWSTFWVRTSQAQLPVCVSFSASAKYASLRCSFYCANLCWIATPARFVIWSTNS